MPGQSLFLLCFWFTRSRAQGLREQGVLLGCATKNFLSTKFLNQGFLHAEQLSHGQWVIFPVYWHEELGNRIPEKGRSKERKGKERLNLVLLGTEVNHCLCEGHCQSHCEDF